MKAGQPLLPGNTKSCGDRIKFCMQATGINEITLANHVGTSPSRIKGFINNTIKPDVDEGRLMAGLICPGNYDWLIHGIDTRGSTISIN